MSRLVWPERDGDTCRLVVDLAAIADAGLTPATDGLLVIPLDVMALISHGREIDEIRTGLMLALRYPPGPRPTE